MQTRFLPELSNTPEGLEANAIVRKCVHCGFCNATCPTYQVKGDELDGPRGRIYLIKQMLEGAEATASTLTHLDRCLTCRSCETTCPSGVEYRALLDIGRQQAEKRIARPLPQRIARWMLRTVLTSPRLFSALLRCGRLLKPMLPLALRSKIPLQQELADWPEPRHQRRMLVLDGCVQPTLAPNINQQAAVVLDKLGISLLRAEGGGCCGAISQHLSAPEQALQMMRNNIDAWWPYVESGVEAIVMTASGCGVQVKDYGHYLREDNNYADKAVKISSITKDIAEVLAAEDLTRLTVVPCKLAFQSPCSLQHGQKLSGAVEAILQKLGFQLAPVADAHLCCGSAGTYSLLQPGIARQLRDDKLAALEKGGAELIATANIGCMLHLQGGTSKHVVHWLALLV